MKIRLAARRAATAALTVGAVTFALLCTGSIAHAVPAANDGFSNSMRGDFNGDGRDDIVTFTRGTSADVFVALSNGSNAFVGTGVKWHDYFAAGSEVPEVGDFNGDGCDDIASFSRGTDADVYVAVSNCRNGFVGTGVKWHDYFAAGSEVPEVGDFNGDGCDDIASFSRGTDADVYVAVSNCRNGFVGTGVKWHDYFAAGSEVPEVGDFNGDGCDDIASFTRGTDADVYVAVSNCRNGFVGTGVKWHDYFAGGTEVPGIGDFNGDGRDDIITFTRGDSADVYVALSNGSNAFVGTGVKWHDYFAAGAEVPGIGDFNGDGCDDIASFTRGTPADVYVALSAIGNRFDTRAKWHDYFAVGNEIPSPGILW